MSVSNDFSFPPSSSSSSSSPHEDSSTVDNHRSEVSTHTIADRLLNLSQKALVTDVPPAQGLSKFHRSILSQSANRQRFVTGKYPLSVTVQDTPTRKWLGSGQTTATAQLFVNGTAVDRSLASFDRFQWIDQEERDELMDRYNLVSLELLAEIHLKKPGYVNVLPAHGAGASAAVQRSVSETSWTNPWKRNSVLYEEFENSKWKAPYGDRIWVTGFSIASQKGYLHGIDAETGHVESVNGRTSSSIRWPNESNSVPILRYQKVDADVVPCAGNFGVHKITEDMDDALLISDGFLVPGKEKGGLYVVKNPGNDKSEWSVCLTGGTADSEPWFYHRAVWIDLTGDGRKSILTARAKPPSVWANKNRSKDHDKKRNSAKSGQLVWLEMPKPKHIDEATGTSLEKDGTVFDPFSARHIPWKIHVLDEGPDVMFAVADLDVEDNTIEVIASQFFQRRVTLHSIHRGPLPQITFRRVLDDKCGAAFGSILADLQPVSDERSGDERVVMDSGSTVPTLKPGDSFSHLLVTSHECSFEDQSHNFDMDTSPLTADDDDDEVIPHKVNVDGGSLFAYRIPQGKRSWKTEPWSRTTLASGFRVKGQLGNMINPGAPGFVYTFHSIKDGGRIGKRPLIAVAGDCAESAYIFRPVDSRQETDGRPCSDPAARYKLMCEIDTGATVGSIGIGYSNFCSEEQQSNYAKLYVPCYEKDKIYVFAMGDGEDEYAAMDAGGW